MSDQKSGGENVDRDFLESLGIAEDNIDLILQKANDDMTKERIISSAQNELSKRGVKNLNAAMKLLDIEGVESDNLLQKIDDFANENDFLFESTSSKPVFSGNVSTQKESCVTKEEFSKMGYIERLKLFNENPDNYRQLTE